MRTFLARTTVVAMCLAAAVVSTPGGSEAITFVYAGVCETECAQIDLTAGDAVSGFISFDDGTLVPGSPYPAPTSFAFNFGVVEITEATALDFRLWDRLNPFVAVPAVVPGDITNFGASVVTSENLHTNPDPTPGEGVGIEPVGIWVAGTQTLCAGNDCEFLSTRTGFASGSGAWFSTAVPEPTTLSLLAVGVLGAAWVRRRR
jgi:hypothetical protein